MRNREIVDACVSEERKGKRKLMNNKEEADVKIWESYVELGNHSHTDLPEFDRVLGNTLITE